MILCYSHTTQGKQIEQGVDKHDRAIQYNTIQYNIIYYTQSMSLHGNMREILNNSITEITNYLKILKSRDVYREAKYVCDDPKLM